ncbi:MAG: septal ring lytic transglycosylase RlpA family protein [Ignavibacteriales bacterium]|nr:septal ring lytic transglycosylase RlpA family protein [Ignavibacteriales bacterium]
MAFLDSLQSKLLKGGVILAFSLFVLQGCSSTVRIPSGDNKPSVENRQEEDNTSSFNLSVVSTFTGKATYYADKFQNQKTASGEAYKKNKFTAAHKDLPFNTLVKVTNLKNGLSVVVKINDRGPFGNDREIDLSYIAAKSIGMINDGVVQVQIDVLQRN